MADTKPIQVINSAAPIRICDNGGWTDTWFARHGAIFNIGVYPYAAVQVQVFPPGAQENRITINAENFGERYTVQTDTIQTASVQTDGTQAGKHWNRYPLLEAAIEYMRLPKDITLEITIFSEAPSGASTGTSAAVGVALVGALDCLTPGHMTSHEVAYAAQRIETEMLHLECGIQDQLCAAYGGINYIEMHEYPHASVSQIVVPNSTWWELERRLVLIYLGKSHHSSEVHARVIQGLKSAGPECKQLEDLRRTAARSRDAVYAGDFENLGAAMIDNTSAQERLHPDLISAEARRVIEIGRAYGAYGWKVNGAGGEGGSITLLCGPLSQTKRAMIGEIEQENPAFKNIPIYLSRYGLRVWKQ